jgi:hypothetical protein
MGCPNLGFDINKLVLISAIVTLLGDFLALLAAYQQYCDALQNKAKNGQAQQGTQALIENDLRVRRIF